MTNDDNVPIGDTCPNLPKCPMFAAFASESSGKLFRTFYCESKYSDCQRYQKGNAGEIVSDFLLPNGTSLHVR